ncbi:MAG: hypothetical protein GY866_11945 [Proteobacteria bacterium]|nr:hypothetical protein [Pseudomonadota bacterium]
MKNGAISDPFNSALRTTDTSEDMVSLYTHYQEAPSPEDNEAAQEIIRRIESDPFSAVEFFFSHTETAGASTSQVFLLILQYAPEYAYAILEHLPENDYLQFNEDVLSLYPVEVSTIIFEKIPASRQIDLNRSNIDIIKLLFTNSNARLILDQLPEPTLDLLSHHVSESMLEDKTISDALINTYKKVGLRVFLDITRKIKEERLFEFIKTRITCSCPVKTLRDLLDEYLKKCFANRTCENFPLSFLLHDSSDETLSEIFNDYLEYLNQIAPENSYHVFVNKSGFSAELLPLLFEVMFYTNRNIAYRILKNIKGQHKEFAQIIFKKLTKESQKYLLERSLLENTQGNQRTKIELAEIIVYAQEQEVIDLLSIDCVYKLFIHFIRDYYDIENTTVRADILIGMEQVVNRLSPDKLKSVLSKVKSQNFIAFFRRFPICKDVLDLLIEETKTVHPARRAEDATGNSMSEARKMVDTLSWLKKQNLKNPVTTVDVINSLETVLNDYLAELRTYSDTIAPKTGKESMDTVLSKIIDTHYLSFKNAASLEQSALWFEFYIKIQQFRQDFKSIHFHDASIESERMADFRIIAQYLNSFFSKILNEKITIKMDSVEIESIFLPDDFEQITGRVKVIELKDFRNEEDMAIYYRQFKYLKPSNLAIVYGFPADYSSTGKAGAIITGALGDRDQYETAHSYKRAREIASPLAFFPNARVAFQHLDDNWATIFKAGDRIYLRTATKEEIDKRIQETKKTLSPKSVAGFIPDAWPERDIVDCRDLKNNVAHYTGRKSEMLGRLISLFPNETETDSFTWSFAPYAKKRKFATIKEVPQIEFIRTVLTSHDLSDHIERNKAANKIHHSFAMNPLDTTTTYFKELWNKVMATFGYSDTITQGFMIRLTMNLEDRPEISAAGVYLSLPVLPGTNKEKLAAAVNELYKSAYSPKAIEIRELMNVSHINTYAAVLFERMPNWKNPILSGNLIVNSKTISGGFAVGHGIYLMDKGSKPPLVFNCSLEGNGYPITVQTEQEDKSLPQNNHQSPYAKIDLTREEKDILAYPEKFIDKQVIDTIINNGILLRNTFGDQASWDIELTIEFEKGIRKIRTHQARPIVK